MGDINSESPSFRDFLLKKNIGDYSFYDFKCGLGIGLPIDLKYNENLKERITPNGILEYTNKNIDTEKENLFKGEKFVLKDLYFGLNSNNKIYDQYDKYKTYEDYINDIRKPYGIINPIMSAISGRGISFDLMGGKVGIETSFNVERYLGTSLVKLFNENLDTKLGNTSKWILANSLMNNSLNKVNKNIVAPTLSKIKGTLTFWTDKDDKEGWYLNNNITVNDTKWKKFVDSVRDNLGFANYDLDFNEKASIFSDDHKSGLFGVSVDLQNQALFDNTSRLVKKITLNQLSHNKYSPKLKYSNGVYSNGKKEHDGDYLDVIKEVINSNKTYLSDSKKVYNNDFSKLNDDTTKQNVFSDVKNQIDIINKTKILFENNFIKTILGPNDNSIKTKSDIESAIGANGLSKGRNLTSSNGELFRVWNEDKQYASLRDLMRFKKGLYHDRLNNTIRPNKSSQRANTVVDDNGFVKIAPYDTDNPKSIKKYMFSIENLAWKGHEFGNYHFERGNLGGRIMWFPPYDLKFSDNTNVNWDTHNFIGRGEPVYTYSNTNRSGNISFKILIDHPSIVDYWKLKAETKKLTPNDADDKLLRFYAGEDISGFSINDDNSVNSGFGEFGTLVSQSNKIENNFNNVVNKFKETLQFKIYFSNSSSQIDYDFLKEYENTIFNDLTLSNIPPNLYKYNRDGESVTYGDYTDITLNDLNSGGRVKDEHIPTEIDVDEEFEDYELKHAFNRFDLTNFGLNNDAYEKLYGKDGKNTYFDNKEILEIKISASASGHGSIPTNDLLIKKRGESIKKFLEEFFKLKHKSIKKITIENQPSIDNEDGINVSNRKVKEKRCVTISIDVISSYIYQTTFDKKVNELIGLNDTYNHKMKVNEPYNEYYFFKRLSEDTDKLNYDKIIQKINYFDPSFHSITPEGFNSRLTFLQQCTRQGNTTINSETKYATNLSFGRPPICVLRVGDFYHTKIVISSLNISFDDLKWDFNPEGIGMQPMMATVNIGFNFIGGSDISGPISRLQNAVSFNYYANTSVYDDRSDIVTITDDKAVYTKINGETT